MANPRTALSDTVLLVDAQEWTSRSVESILRPKGLAVLKAFTGRQALELASRVSPDLIIVDFRLPDMDGVDLVRQLGERRILDPVTPLLMLSTGSAARAERLEALGAGAWEILRHPLDPVEFVLRVDNFLGAKRGADRLRQEIITDPDTGFYNARGLLRRAREMSADSVRSGQSLACIAVGPDWAGDLPESDRPHPASPSPDVVVPAMAEALRAVVRQSDPVGRLGPAEFVIVLSGVDGHEAAQLAERVVRQATSAGHPATPTVGGTAADVRLRAGVYVAHPDGPVDPEQLLSKATLALRRAQVADGSFSIQTFDA